MLSKLCISLRMDYDQLQAAERILHDMYEEQDAIKTGSPSAFMLLGAYSVLTILEGGCTTPQEFEKKVRRVMLCQTDLGAVDPVTGELIEKPEGAE